jgi:hypothetical protein
MAKRKTGAQWRRFLQTLARTGNARAAAAEAGMDVATAYDRRIKDAGFAVKWEAARAKAKGRPSPRPSPRSGRGRSAELVLRRTKHGDKLVRAGAGRWNAGAEAIFLGELRRTGCVRWSAAACRFSTTALYKRRSIYADFAARWAAAEAEAKERIPALLSAAAIASFDPEVADDDLPRVNVDQAIQIARLKCSSGAARGKAIEEPPIEEVRASIMRKLDAIEAHEQRMAAGKAKKGNGDSPEGGNGDSYEIGDSYE